MLFFLNKFHTNQDITNNNLIRSSVLLVFADYVTAAPPTSYDDEQSESVVYRN